MLKTMNEKTIKVQLIGFLPALTLILITLRLCGVIDWWWPWVLAPIWGPPVLGVLLVVAVFVIVFIASFAFTLVQKFLNR